MRNLVKLLVVLLLTMLSAQSFAQTFGVKGGLNLSNMSSKDNDTVYSNDHKMNPGFNIGGTVEFPITGTFSFETGLLFSTKGYRINKDETVQGQTSNTKGYTTLYYFDIPLTAKASFDIGSAKIYGAFGPYLGIGLFGKSKAEFTFSGNSDTFKRDVTFGSNGLKRLDIGLSIGAGVDINAFQVGLSYGISLANISNYTDNGFTAKNRVLGLSVGYKFIRK